MRRTCQSHDLFHRNQRWDTFNEKRLYLSTQCSKRNGWNSDYSLRKSNTYMYLTSWCSCCCILAAIGHPDKLRTKQEQSWNWKTLAFTTENFHELQLSETVTYLLWVAYCPETWPLPSQLGVGQLCTKINNKKCHYFMNDSSATPAPVVETYCAKRKMSFWANPSCS